MQTHSTPESSANHTDLACEISFTSSTQPILYPKRGENIQVRKRQLLTPLRFAQACPLSGGPFLRPPPPRPLSVYGPLWQLGPAEVVTYGPLPVSV